MRNIHHIPKFLLAGTLAAGGLAAHEDHGPRHQAPHVHGAARLELVIDGQEVHLGLDSPAANLVGFEHAPTSPSEQEALDRVLATLRDGERLFRFSPAAECRMVEVEVDTPLADPHQDEDEAHDHSHAEAGSEGDQDGAHADIRAAYRFTCRHPERLKALEVGLLEAFPAIERLRVEHVTSAGQGAQDLTPGRGKVELTP